MDLKKFKVEELKVVPTIKCILRQLATHFDGDSTNAHVIGTELKAGFASPEVTRLAKGHFIKDNDIGLKYPNIFDLPFGSYATTWQFADTPKPPAVVDKGIVNVVVMGEHATRKIIYVFGGSTGGRVSFALNYNQNTAGGGGAPTLWRIMESTADLWAGTVDTHNQVLELNDSLTNYSNFKIWYRFNGEQVAETFSSQISINLPYTATDDSSGYSIGKIRLTPDGNNKLVVTLLKRISVGEGGTTNVATSKDSGITIVRIKGVR